MSLDNTSHPGRPGPDELVPSRYALRVGEIDVLVVSDGVISLPACVVHGPCGRDHHGVSTPKRVARGSRAIS
jgi:hypothetical protein